MTVGIVGGGIAGLATAVCFDKLFPEVNYLVFEQASELKEVGAGIGLGQNAVAILTKLGLLDKLLAIATPITNTQIRNTQNRIVKALPVGEGGYCVRRAELLNLLRDNMNEDRIRLNKKCTDFSIDNTIQLSFGDTSTVELDLVIAADGINSLFRKRVMPSKVVRHSQQSCYRGISDIKLEGGYQSNYIEYIGNNLRFGLVELRPAQAYWYAVEVVGEHFHDVAAERKEHLLTKFAGFPSIVTQTIEQTPHILRNDMCDLTPSADRWYTETICLVGDAAHATTPNLAQGGCQALEDAYTVVSLLSGVDKPVQAFEKYQRLRQPKVDFIVNQSWRYGKVTHSQSKWLEKLVLCGYSLVPDAFLAQQLHTINRMDYIENVKSSF